MLLFSFLFLLLCFFGFIDCFFLQIFVFFFTGILWKQNLATIVFKDYKNLPNKEKPTHKIDTNWAKTVITVILAAHLPCSGQIWCDWFICNFRVPRKDVIFLGCLRWFSGSFHSSCRTVFRYKKRTIHISTSLFMTFEEGPVMRGRTPPPLPKAVLFQCTPPHFSKQFKGKSWRS